MKILRIIVRIATELPMILLKEIGDILLLMVLFIPALIDCIFFDWRTHRIIEEELGIELVDKR